MATGKRMYTGSMQCRFDFKHWCDLKVNFGEQTIVNLLKIFCK